MSKLGNEVPKECDDDPSIKQIGSELKHEKSFVKLRTKDFHMEQSCLQLHSSNCLTVVFERQANQIKLAKYHYKRKLMNSTCYHVTRNCMEK